MVSLLLTCLTIWLSLLSGGVFIGATPRGQPWMPALTPPPVRYELNVRRMVGFCTCSMPSSSSPKI